jgi:pimeloyl-ACP methyl ester carboxylesterase
MTNEMSGLAELTADAVDRLALTPAELLHAAIARRVFTRIGIAATPARVIHDRAARSAYAVTRRAVLDGAGAMSRRLRAARGDADAVPLSRTRRGRDALAAINAFAGDRLVERNNDLAIRMAVRAHGVDVPLGRDDLARAFPRATPSVAVFLHGLAETEEWWVRRPGAERRRRGRSFGARLRQDAGYTPVYVRYNTGLHVSDNGTHLAALLESLMGSWPVGVERVVLIGHSMGGLVIRSACHAGALAGHRWPAATGHVVTLGTPHHGAPLAKAVHAAAWALRIVPEAQPMAYILDLRSAGLRDLRLGALHEDDWRDEHTAGFADRRRDIPLLPGCGYTFITATVTVDPAHPIGLAVGDLLVRTDSAGGRSRRRIVPVPPGSVMHVGGLSHFDLLDHPAVYDVLRDAIAGGDRSTSR